ncbi:hypothetical protein [Mesorhizobium sp. B2-4-17]|uniref:hypothetical protein n=1 Tax=Mesorhizobium sp. B2-4-17 TaxID=2589932 RepID=UPI001FEE9A4D|nr:hypothetical protein [Mesorhizobium sp. B2-4-17]
METAKMILLRLLHASEAAMGNVPALCSAFPHPLRLSSWPTRQGGNPSCHKQAGNIREKAEKRIMENTAFACRDLSLDDLGLYEAFLASPAGSHYYDQMQVALGAAITDEARAVEQRFFVALGYRKA